MTKWCVKDGVCQSGVKDGVSKMVGDKVVRERWCVKDGVSKRVCVKDGVRSGAVMGCDVISEV